MVHVITRDQGKALVWEAAWDHIDVQGLCRTVPTPHWLWHLGELAPTLASGRVGPAHHLGSTVELAMLAGTQVSQP